MSSDDKQASTPDSGPATDKDSTAKSGKEKKPRDPVKFWTRVTLAVLVLLFVAHVVSDKYLPYTANARVNAYVVPLSADVSGRLSKVYVTNNQLVKEGDKLLEIDAEKYQLVVDQARADLQQAGQGSDADMAGVTTAQARVAEAEANLANAKVKGERLIRLAEQGAASQSRADDAKTRIVASEAKLDSARSELQKAKSKLGGTGVDNAAVKVAMANLAKAELDLKRATVVAPSDGVISNFTIDVGHYANTGAPLLTFISIRDVWIQADMRENTLAHIKEGDRVDILLDAAPGRVYGGKIRSVGWGVSDNTKDQLGTLTTVSTTQGWLREAQHFPVIVDFDDLSESKGFKRAGGQANVIVYTGSSNGFYNFFGRSWIKLLSWFSHVY